MTYQRPLLPPDVDPLAPGANPPPYREIDRTGNSNTGIIVALLLHC
jgi:hypothetical protein